MTQRIGAALLEGSVSVGLAASMRRDMTMEAAHLHYFLLRAITTEKKLCTTILIPTIVVMMTITASNNCTSAYVGRNCRG